MVGVRRDWVRAYTSGVYIVVVGRKPERTLVRQSALSACVATGLRGGAAQRGHWGWTVVPAEHDSPRVDRAPASLAPGSVERKAARCWGSAVEPGEARGSCRTLRSGDFLWSRHLQPPLKDGPDDPLRLPRAIASASSGGIS